VNLVIGCAIAFWLAGPIPIRLEGLVMFAVVLPLAFTLDFLGHFMVGLGAFWLESTAGLALLYTRSVMLLGGLLLPLGMYPEVLQPVLRVLPFAGIVHAPGRMFVDPHAGLLREAVGQQALAVLVLGGMTVAVQKVAFRRVFSNGG
jgi:ABC-2 type transport system permease protein